MSPYQRYLPIPWVSPPPSVPHTRRYHWISSYQHHLPIPTSNVTGCLLSPSWDKDFLVSRFCFRGFPIPLRDNVAALKPGCTCKRALPSPLCHPDYSRNYRRDFVPIFFRWRLLSVCSAMRSPAAAGAVDLSRQHGGLIFGLANRISGFGGCRDKHDWRWFLEWLFEKGNVFCLSRRVFGCSSCLFVSVLIYFRFVIF